ncbi:PREDICTED: beta-lactamase-like protein 2 isoform X2 [Priapulus caudatus]|uniref:Beta-lactamase-like protein 2 isoform X2 n=1 Tax=Priapulus caudatus TaxID=37621 RepID=A0ABM1DP10_PRICU|nr:PREDICTED: beta-lactamase-like protein 2 isoform X2 [Priapulus caudatus]
MDMSQRILLDTGVGGIQDYISNLQNVLKDNKIAIQEIVISHWHPDHIGGIVEVAELLKESVRISKYPRQARDDEEIGGGLKYSFLKDKAIISTEGATLRAVFTPGHSDDHLVYVLEEENAVFSGDCILGEGTSVFEDLYDYMRSLNVIKGLNPDIIYPGHGPVIRNPMPKIEEYIKHRLLRESQIYDTLKQSSSPLTAMQIVKKIYVDTPVVLHKAAEGNVLLHIGKLVKDNKIDKSVDSEDVYWQAKS